MELVGYRAVRPDLDPRIPALEKESSRDPGLREIRGLRTEECPERILVSAEGDADQDGSGDSDGGSTLE
jgi:hypothetical protein